MAKYICKNYGSCSKADAREQIEIAPGAEPICEECGFKLELADEDSSVATNKKKVIVGGLVAAILVAGVGMYLGIGTNSGSKGSSPSALTEGAQKPASKLSGLPPDDKVLAEQKKDADAKIVASGGVGAASTQSSVIAKEFIKAAIPLMQAGKWAEAESQLTKAKNENPDEPLIYYNLAIVKLKQSQSKEALAEIENAFKKGFKDFQALEADGDLKPLVAKTEYKALSTQYKPK